MAHGAPDYSNVRKEEFVYRVDDMAELSARLSKSVSLERRGETVFYEDFSDGLKALDKGSWGTGGSAKLTAAEFVSKGFAGELIGGSDDALRARFDYQLPLLSMSKVGLECRWKQFTGIEAIEIYIDYYDGVTLHNGHFRYYPVEEKLKIRNSADTYVDVLTGIAPPTAGELFDYMKLVIDTSTSKYVRAMYNNNLIDLSSYSLHEIADASPKGMVIVPQVFSLSGQNGKAVVDNIIITRNET